MVFLGVLESHRAWAQGAQIDTIARLLTSNGIPVVVQITEAALRDFWKVYKPS